VRRRLRSLPTKPRRPNDSCSAAKAAASHSGAKVASSSLRTRPPPCRRSAAGTRRTVWWSAAQRVCSGIGHVANHLWGALTVSIAKAHAHRRRERKPVDRTRSRVQLEVGERARAFEVDQRDAEVSAALACGAALQALTEVGGSMGPALAQYADGPGARVGETAVASVRCVRTRGHCTVPGQREGQSESYSYRPRWRWCGCSCVRSGATIRPRRRCPQLKLGRPRGELRALVHTRVFDQDRRRVEACSEEFAVDAPLLWLVGSIGFDLRAGLGSGGSGRGSSAVRL
jgi:hypothetical protein